MRTIVWWRVVLWVVLAALAVMAPQVLAEGDYATVSKNPEVRQAYKERESIIRLNGREAVELAIYKEGDANTVATADALERKLETIRKQLPRDIELTTIEDQSIFIRNAIHGVKVDGVIGGILSSTALTLFVLPVLYRWLHRERDGPVTPAPAIA